MVSRNDTDSPSSSSAEPTFEPASGQLPQAPQAADQAADQTPADAPAPRKRASRARAATTTTSRARKKAAAPVEPPVEPTVDAAPQASDAASGEPTVLEEAPAPARKRSRKKAAAAPAASAVEAAAQSPAETSDPGPASESGPESAPESGPATDAPTGDPVDSGAVDSGADLQEAEAEPTLQDTRMSAMTEPAIILATLVDPPTLPEPGDAQDGSDDDNDDNDDNDAADTQEQAPARAALPTFGLLFQAPEPAALPPAPRRVSRPASADVDDESDDLAEFERSEDGDDRDGHPVAGTSAGTSDDETGGQDDDEFGPRRRRRRGGRGRRRDDGSDSTDSTGHAADGADSGDAGADADGSDSADGGNGEDGDDVGGASDGSSDGATSSRSRRSRTRGSRGRSGSTTAGSPSGGDADDTSSTGDDADDSDDSGSDGATEEGSDSPIGRRRTRRRRRSGSVDTSTDDPPGTVTRVREPRQPAQRDVATGIRGSTRLEAKRQRRREGREAGRRRTIITEAEFLARRESVERVMVVRQQGPLTQIGVLEDGVLVEHYISGPGSTSHVAGSSMAGNVYLGRVQNVLPSMEAAFVDIGKGRNAVLYAGEVNWDAAGLEQHKARRIENALSSGQGVLVQVTKDPIGHKGARLTSQVSLPGRYLVYVPDGSMTGISRKLPDTERARLKKILKDIVPENAGVIVRTAAEGASEEELRADVDRLTKDWERIQAKAKSGNAPVLLHGEPDLTVRVVRDVFNEDFTKLVVSGDDAWSMISDYVHHVADDLSERLTQWTGEHDVFAHYRIDEQLTKAMDRKVWLPSGGSLVIDRTEAMTVVDVNTGKFTGSGGNLEETVTKNNIEAAEEIVRQLRLRDIGGIIVIDFIDMVLESNRDLVVRRLLECLGRDRTKHQVAEVTSLGLVQMTRKRVGAGLIEVFSEPCEHCAGRGLVVHAEPVDRSHGSDGSGSGNGGSRGGDSRDSRSRRGRSRDSGSGHNGNGNGSAQAAGGDAASAPAPTGPTPAQIAAAAYAAAVNAGSHGSAADPGEVDERVAQVAADIEVAVERAQTAQSTASTPSDSAASDSAASGATSVAGGPDATLDAQAVVEAVTRVLDETTVASESTAPAAAAAPARRRGARRAVRTAATAPASSAGAGVFVAAPTGGNAEVAQALEAEPVAPSVTPTPEVGEVAAPVTPPAPQRRKRARVVAPAGPPTGGDAESAGSGAGGSDPQASSEFGA